MKKNWGKRLLSIVLLGCVYFATFSFNRTSFAAELEGNNSEIISKTLEAADENSKTDSNDNSDSNSLDQENKDQKTGVQENASDQITDGENTGKTGLNEDTTDGEALGEEATESDNEETAGEKTFDQEIADEAEISDEKNDMEEALNGDTAKSCKCGDDLTFSLVSNNGTSFYEMTISGTGEMYDYNETDNLAPWKTKAGLKAAGYSNVDPAKIISVEIESGVTSIGDYAFGASSEAKCPLAGISFTFEGGLDKIGKYAFANIPFENSNSTLKNTINSETLGVNYFDEGCFENFKIDYTSSYGHTISFDFSDTTYIGDNAFYNFVGLEVDNPVFSKVTYIGKNAFYGCFGEGFLNFEGNTVLTEIGENAFRGIAIDDTIFIPSSVSKIGANAFYNTNVAENSRLNFYIPDSVTEIGTDAFKVNGSRYIFCQSENGTAYKTNFEENLTKVLSSNAVTISYVNVDSNSIETILTKEMQKTGDAIYKTNYVPETSKFTQKFNGWSLKDSSEDYFATHTTVGTESVVLYKNFADKVIEYYLKDADGNIYDTTRGISLHVGESSAWFRPYVSIDGEETLLVDYLDDNNLYYSDDCDLWAIGTCSDEDPTKITENDLDKYKDYLKILPETVLNFQEKGLRIKAKGQYEGKLYVWIKFSARNDAYTDELDVKIVVPVTILAAEEGKTYEEVSENLSDYKECGTLSNVKDTNSYYWTKAREDIFFGRNLISYMNLLPESYDYLATLTNENNNQDWMYKYMQDFYEEREGAEGWSGDYFFFSGTMNEEDYIYGTYESIKNDPYYNVYDYYGQEFLVDSVTLTNSYGEAVDYETQQPEIKNIVADLLKEGGEIDATKYNSDYQRAKAAYDWITKNIKYESGYNSNNESLYYFAYAGFTEHKGSCECMAQCFYYLCRELGVKVRILFNASGHVYNIVQVNGTWYYTDCSAGYLLKGSNSVGSFKPLNFIYGSPGDYDYDYYMKNYINKVSKTDYVYKPEHTLKFVAGENASVEVTSKTLSEGNAYGELPTPVSSDNEVEFEGWFTEAQSDLNTSATQVTSSTKMGKADVTVYAWWKPLPAVLTPYTSDVENSNEEGTACNTDVAPGYLVNLFCDTPGAKIYYTTGLDEIPADPSNLSTLFTDSIELPQGENLTAGKTRTYTIKAIAYYGQAASSVMTYSYNMPDDLALEDYWGDADKTLFDSSLSTFADYENIFWLTLNGSLWNDAPEVVYTGSAVAISGYELYFGNKKLTQGKDYTVKYANNTAAADLTAKKVPTITFTGKGSYSGTISKQFIIKKGAASVKATTKNITISLKDTSAIIYTGQEIEPEIVVTYKSGKNAEPVTVSSDDYEVSYSNNINASKKAKITVTFNGTNYYGQLSKTFTIGQIPLNTVENLKIDNSAVDTSDIVKNVRFFNKGDVTYIAGVTNPVESVLVNDIELVEKQDYTVSKQVANKHFVTNGKSVTLTGKGNYSGKVTVCFILNKANLNTLDEANKIEISYVTPVATNKAGDYKLTNLVIYDNSGSESKKLTAGKDYDKSFKYTTSDGSDIASKAKLAAGTDIICTITGKGNYEGTLTVEYSMLSNYTFSDNITVSVGNVTYAAKANICKPSIIITSNITGKKLTLNKDYVISGYNYVNATRVDYKSSKKLLSTTRAAGDAVASGDIIPAGTSLTVTISAKEGGVYFDSDSSKNSITRDFVIANSIAKASVKIPEKIASDTAVTLTKDDITLSVGKTVLSSNDYDIISYTNNTKAGTATVYLQGKGNYCGIRKATFKIKAKSMYYTVTYMVNGGYYKTIMTSVVKDGGSLAKCKYVAADPAYEFGGWSFEQYLYPDFVEENITPEFAVSSPKQAPLFNLSSVNITPTSGVNEGKTINSSTLKPGAEIVLYAYWRMKSN